MIKKSSISTRRRGRSGGLDFKSIATQFWLPALALVAMLVLTAQSTLYYIPPLTNVFEKFVSSWLGPGLTANVIPSLTRMFAGLFIAIVLGVVGGVILGSVARLRRMIMPLLEFLRGMPSPALLPFGIVIFGIGDSMKIFVIALVCVFPILLNTIDGVLGLNRTKRMVTAVYRIRPFDQFRLVVLPAALPQIFAGIRTSIALALIMVVFSEMVASTDGIGRAILLAQRDYNMVQMWAGILLLGLLGYLFNLIFALIERRVLAWHRASKESKLTSN